MQLLRYFLFPFSLVYGIITWVRNKLFDWKIKPQHPIPFPSIGVGNLSVGGTGKTPHILLLNKWLSEDHHISIISRGYGRKTKGLLWADENSTAETIGDEPMLFWQTTPQPELLVSEKRVKAVEALTEKGEKTVVLLDDVFQHRHIKPGLNILLCDYNRPYFKDYMLPTGNLREFRCGEQRADLVIVTKCPETLSEQDKKSFKSQINQPSKAVFFSKISYGTWQAFSKPALPSEIENIILVSGIANPKPLKTHLSQFGSLKTVIFPDHHAFTKKDINEIHEIFGNFASEKSVIVTTEKDAMRLLKFRSEGILDKFPWFIQKMDVLIDREIELKEKIKTYVREVQ